MSFSQSHIESVKSGTVAFSANQVTVSLHYKESGCEQLNALYAQEMDYINGALSHLVPKLMLDDVVTITFTYDSGIVYYNIDDLNKFTMICITIFVSVIIPLVWRNWGNWQYVTFNNCQQFDYSSGWVRVNAQNIFSELDQLYGMYWNFLRSEERRLFLTVGYNSYQLRQKINNYFNDLYSTQNIQYDVESDESYDLDTDLMVAQLLAEPIEEPTEGPRCNY